VATAKYDNNNGSLLIVEDDPGVRSVLFLMLNRAGFAVTEAGTRTDVLAHLEAGGVAGVVLDLSLPDRRSGDVLQWLHAHEDQPPWLVLSSLDLTDAMRLDKSINDRFIAKPFDPGLLVERIKAMTGRNGGVIA
jgi:DNA-binding response OmpR family regulator